jgi:hypothetical protein
MSDHYIVASPSTTCRSQPYVRFIFEKSFLGFWSLNCPIYYWTKVLKILLNNWISEWDYWFWITVPDWSWLGGGRERTSPLVIVTYSHCTLRFFKNLLVWSGVWALLLMNQKSKLDKNCAWLRSWLVLIRWRKGADKSVGHFYLFTNRHKVFQIFTALNLECI